MTSLNISLPEPLREWVDGRVAEGGYSTASEFVRELIRDAQKKVADERLALALLEGDEHPPPGVEITPERWQRLRERASKHVEKLLLEGLDSGPPTEVTPEFWQRLHERVENQITEQDVVSKR